MWQSVWEQFMISTCCSPQSWKETSICESLNPRFFGSVMKQPYEIYYCFCMDTMDSFSYSWKDKGNYLGLYWFFFFPGRNIKRNKCIASHSGLCKLLSVCICCFTKPWFLHFPLYGGSLYPLKDQFSTHPPREFAFIFPDAIGQYY